MMMQVLQSRPCLTGWLFFLFFLELTMPHRLIVFSVFSRVNCTSQVDCFSIFLESHLELSSSCQSLNAARCMLLMTMQVLWSWPHLTGCLFFQSRPHLTGWLFFLFFWRVIQSHHHHASLWMQPGACFWWQRRCSRVDHASQVDWFFCFFWSWLCLTGWLFFLFFLDSHHRLIVFSVFFRSW